MPDALRGLAAVATHAARVAESAGVFVRSELTRARHTIASVA
jgi:hypothetical protein